MGLLRNLSAAQIVEQLVEAKRLLAETGEDGSATNIVFMGMGSPPALPASCIAQPIIRCLLSSRIVLPYQGCPTSVLLESQRTLHDSNPLTSMQHAKRAHISTDMS